MQLRFVSDRATRASGPERTGADRIEFRFGLVWFGLVWFGCCSEYGYNGACGKRAGVE